MSVLACLGISEILPRMMAAAAGGEGVWGEAGVGVGGSTERARERK